MSATGKICVVCGKDCSAIPRVKDPQGRYSCKVCNDALVAKAQAKASAQPAPKPVVVSRAPAKVAAVPATDDGHDLSGFSEPETDPGLAASLAHAGSGGGTPVQSMVSMCPQCNTQVSAGQAICVACGCNLKSGKKMKVKVSKEGEGAGAVAATVLWKANPLVWALGGLVGGGIGAAAWAALAYYADFETAWLALGVGFLTGTGVAVMAGNNCGAISGLLAIVIALASIVGGRYWAISLFYDNSPIFSRLADVEKMTDEDLVFVLSVAIAKEREDAGSRTPLNNGRTLKNVRDRRDIPAGLWREATAVWESKDEDEKSEIRNALAQTFGPGAGELKESVFWETLRPIHALAFIFAMFGAWKIGSEGGGIKRS